MRLARRGSSAGSTYTGEIISTLCLRCSLPASPLCPAASVSHKHAITGHMLYKSVMCLFEVTKPFQFFHLLIIFFNVTFLFPSELLRSKQEQMHLWIILTNPEENVQNSLPFTVFFFIYIKKKEIKRPWHWTLLAYRLRQQLWIDDWRPFQPFCHTFVFAEALLAEEINVFFQLPCPFDLLFFEKTNTTLIIKRRIRDSNN